jgi:hypothetical protein
LCRIDRASKPTRSRNDGDATTIQTAGLTGTACLTETRRDSSTCSNDRGKAFPRRDINEIGKRERPTGPASTSAIATVPTSRGPASAYDNAGYLRDTGWDHKEKVSGIREPDFTEWRRIGQLDAGTPERYLRGDQDQTNPPLNVQRIVPLAWT